MAMTYNALESGLALGVTLFINVAVVIVSAALVDSPLARPQAPRSPSNAAPQLLHFTPICGTVQTWPCGFVHSGVA